MKAQTEYLVLNLPQRRGFVNITRQVEKVVKASGVQEGMVLVNAMHISASVFINDDESGLHHVYEVWLEKLAPHAPTSQYRHNDTGRTTPTRMKRQVMAREVVVAVTEGQLDFALGSRSSRKFDGRRKKRVAHQGDRRMSEARIRPIGEADVPPVHQLLRGLAEYEKLTEILTGTPEMLRDALFGDGARLEGLVAEREGELVGYALFYPVFGSFRARWRLWLEDLYVEPGERGAGTGAALMAELARITLERGWFSIDGK
jgi:secondary thiamine-phosphate synthase enzyme